MTDEVVVHWGLTEYQSVWSAMRDFTDRRSPGEPDQIWLTEHFPVYTRGISCRDNPDPAGKSIPVIDSDRGGQMTYHGPGQIVAYLLLNLKRRRFGPRSLVLRVEQAMITVLAQLGITAERRNGAPGVYVNGAKIAALGLRIRKGCCYHGVSLNVRMDLTPYRHIQPCGLAQLRVTQLDDFGVTEERAALERRLVEQLLEQLAPTA